MTDDPNINNEADTTIDNKEAPEPLPTEPLPTEPVTEEPIKNEVTNEEIANEPEFKNKTDRMKHKKVKCNDCNAEMTLKTLRYSHKCSKTEDKPVKPKPKTKPKPKLVTIQPKAIESTNEPTYLLEAKQKSIIQEQPIKSPQEIIFDSYKLIHQEYINKRKEKYNNLCANMFSGNLRSKRK